MAISTIPNAARSAHLREVLGRRHFCRVLEVHSPLAAIIAEHGQGSAPVNREFDGFWSSSLTDSALRGLPDIEILDPQLRVEWISKIFNVSTKPLIMDGDTGGRTEVFAHTVKVLEREGVSAVVIEDKAGDKRNSLLPGDNLHTMAPIDEFCEKIARGKRAQNGPDFMIFARLEGLISGLEFEEIIERATAYRAAGADGLVIHSRSSNESLVFNLARRLKNTDPEMLLIAIPSAYTHVSEEELQAVGFNLVIYANHMLRASILAMEEVSHRILDNGRALEAEEICIKTGSLLSMPEDERPLVRAREDS